MSTDTTKGLQAGHQPRLLAGDEYFLDMCERYRSQSARTSRGHYIAGEVAARRDAFLGIPVIVLSAVAATSTFASLSLHRGMLVQLLTGGISIFAGVLASLQTFFRYREVAEKHKAAAAQYAAVRRRLELIVLDVQIGGATHPGAVSSLNAVAERLADLASGSPHLDERYYRRASRQLASG